MDLKSGLAGRESKLVLVGPSFGVALMLAAVVVTAPVPVGATAGPIAADTEGKNACSASD